MAILEQIKTLGTRKIVIIVASFLGLCALIFFGGKAVDTYYSNKYNKAIQEKETTIKTLQETVQTSTNKAEVAKNLAREYSLKANKYDALIKQLKEKAKEQQSNMDNIKIPQSSMETVERLKAHGLTPEVKCDSK
jgi:esterase/lipase